jgi:hypothetical protein
MSSATVIAMSTSPSAAPETAEESCSSNILNDALADDMNPCPGKCSSGGSKGR